jgi:hypothetical protein
MSKDIKAVPTALRTRVQAILHSGGKSGCAVEMLELGFKIVGILASIMFHQLMTRVPTRISRHEQIKESVRVVSMFAYLTAPHYVRSSCCSNIFREGLSEVKRKLSPHLNRTLLFCNARLLLAMVQERVRKGGSSCGILWRKRQEAAIVRRHSGTNEIRENCTLAQRRPDDHSSRVNGQFR